MSKHGFNYSYCVWVTRCTLFMCRRAWTYIISISFLLNVNLLPQLNSHTSEHVHTLHTEFEQYSIIHIRPHTCTQSNEDYFLYLFISIFNLKTVGKTAFPFSHLGNEMGWNDYTQTSNIQTIHRIYSIQI